MFVVLKFTIVLFLLPLMAAGQGLSSQITNTVIKKWTSPQSFSQISGTATDIAVASDGTAYAIGLGVAPGGNEIFSMGPAAQAWTKLPGGATRIAAGGTVVSVINIQGTIFRSLDGGQTWSSLPGWGSDIAVDDKGDLFVIGLQGAIFEMKAGTSSWLPLPGLGRTDASRIAASGDQQVAVSAGTAIYLIDGSLAGNPWSPPSNSTAPVKDVALVRVSTPTGGVITTLINAVDAAGLMSQCGTMSGVLASGGSYLAVAANSRVVWVLDQANHIYRATM